MASSTEHSTENIAMYSPLAQGAYWIYEGIVKWTKGTEVIEKNMTWKMEVVEVVEREHVIGYLLKGHPADLAWYEEGKEHGEHVIIKVGTGMYYKTNKEVLKRIQEEDFLFDLVHENQLFLAVPLIPGKFFGEAVQITRSDRSYCWVVDEEQYVTLQDIQGVSLTEKMSQFSLSFRTRPDHTIIKFVPGIGITRYVYVHHGTVAEADVKLIEYYPGSENMTISP
jgi:hypothetical protein